MSRHVRRYPITDGVRQSMGTCPDCGKKMYVSKQVAKDAARQAFPGQLMRVYPCGRAWHLTSQTASQTTKWRAYKHKQRGKAS